MGALDGLPSWHNLGQTGSSQSEKETLIEKLPIRFCNSCGCILEFRYTAYIPSIKCSLLGYCCVNHLCVDFGRVFELSWSDTLILSRLGFELRKFGGKRIEH